MHHTILHKNTFVCAYVNMHAYVTRFCVGKVISSCNYFVMMPGFCGTLTCVPVQNILCYYVLHKAQSYDELIKFFVKKMGIFKENHVFMYRPSRKLCAWCTFTIKHNKEQVAVMGIENEK